MKIQLSILAFGLLLVFPFINIFASNDTTRFVTVQGDTTVIVTDTVRVKPATQSVSFNPMNDLFKLLPEICLSFGFDEHKMDASLKKIDKRITNYISLLNAFSKKHPTKATEKEMKQLLASLSLKIGGSKFETRPLDPILVEKFTAENIHMVVEMLANIKITYSQALKQKTMSEKFAVLQSMPKQLQNVKDVELLTAYGKAYMQWTKELNPKQVGNNASNDSSFIAQQKAAKAAENKRNRDIFDSAYTLTAQQVKISALPYTGENGCKLVAIVRGNTDCKVTIAVPIHFPSNWFSTDSTFCIVDKQTNECYVPRSMENNIPLSKVIIVKDCAKKMIEITYVYPPLKKTVQVVDLADAITSPLQIPSNSSGSSEFFNIYLDSYNQKIPARKYIR